MSDEAVMEPPSESTATSQQLEQTIQSSTFKGPSFEQRMAELQKEMGSGQIPIIMPTNPEVVSGTDLTPEPQPAAKPAQPKPNATDAAKGKVDDELAQFAGLLEKPPVPQPDAELEAATKGMSGKASENFKKIYTRATTAEKQLKDLQAKLEVAVNSGGNSERVQELEKAIAERDEIIGKVRLDLHPKFRAAYDDKIKSREDYAAKLAEGHPKLLKRFLAGDDTAFDGIADELGGKYTRLQNVFSEIELIKMEREKELENHKANNLAAEKMAIEERREQERQRATLYDAAIREALTDQTFQPIEGKDAWNADLPTKEKQFREIMTGQLNPKQLAEIAKAYVNTPSLLKIIALYQAKEAKQSEHAKSVKKVEPSFAGNTAGMTPGTAVSQKSYTERILEAASKAGHFHGS